MAVEQTADMESHQDTIELDWIFATILDRSSEACNDRPNSPSTGQVSVFIGDRDTLPAARSLMFQAALSVCDTGGNAVYFAPARWNCLPLKFCDIPYPDVTSLRRLKMVYRTNARETLQTIMEDMKKTSSRVLLVCIEDLTIMCRSVGRKTDWSAIKSVASILSSLEEIIQSARSSRHSLRILSFMDKSIEPECNGVLGRYGVRTSCLLGNADALKAQFFRMAGDNLPVPELSLTVTQEGVKCDIVPCVDTQILQQKIAIDQ